MRRAFIGVFDSGVGGLTVVRELRALLPNERILYLGDTARVPYGNKSKETVQRYAYEALQFLSTVGSELKEREGQVSGASRPPPFEGRDLPLKLVVVACNTVSAVALEGLRQRISVPVIGVIQPAARLAVQSTKNSKVGVIGTRGTIRSGVYQEVLRHLDPGIEVGVQACPLLVPLAEEGWLQHPVTDLTLETYLGTFKVGGFDTLVLGCTHYPLLEPAIQKLLGNEVHLINSAKSTAQESALLLQKRGWLAKSMIQGSNEESMPRGELLCFVTDTPQRFREIAHHFLGEPPESVEQVELSGFVGGMEESHSVRA